MKLKTLFLSLILATSLLLSFSSYADCDPDFDVFCEPDKDDATKNSNFGGIGITFQSESIDNNYFRILAVLKGGPADKAGIQNNDLIVAINNHTTYSTSNDVVAIIKGPVGSNVQLTIKRKDGSLFSVNITRELIKGLSFIRQLADQGDASNQFKLAYKYDIGEGVKKNKNQAAYWYKKAAKQGDVTAQGNLGLTLWNLGGGRKCGSGLFTKKCNHKQKGEGLYWLEKAVENGSFWAKGILQKINQPIIEQHNNYYNTYRNKY